MLKKTIRRLGALAMVLAMAVSVFAVNASAADESSTTLGSDAKTFDNMFEKLVTITGDTTDNVFAPNATFSYSVKAGDAGNVTLISDGKENSVYVKAGKVQKSEAGDVTSPTVGSTAFTPDNSKNVTTDKKAYIEKSNITFGANLFTEPGVYGYEITENDVSYDGIQKDNKTIYMYVYVVNKVSEGKVIGYTVQNVILATKNTKNQYVKTAGFDNNYTLDGTDGKLDLTKVVNGDFGNKGKEWTFTIKNVKGPAGEKYKTNKKDKDGNAIVLNANAKDATEIKLKDGEHFYIYGVTTGDQFEITESEANSEGYTTTYLVGTANDSNKEQKYGDKITATGAKTVTVTNTAQSAPGTGVITTIAPYALMLVVAGAFAVVFLSRRNRAE